MVKFTVNTVEGDEKEVKLFDYLPTRVGMKARTKLQVSMKNDGKQAEVEMENALEKADQSMKYVVEEMLDRSGCDIELDDLAYPSFQAIGKYYWKQIQGKQAKN